MPIIPKQVTVGTTASILTIVPPGPCQVVLTVSGGTQNTIFLGNGSAVTTTTGAHIVGGVPWSVSNFVTTSSTTLWAVASAPTGVGVTIVTPG